VDKAAKKSLQKSVKTCNPIRITILSKKIIEKDRFRFLEDRRANGGFSLSREIYKTFGALLYKKLVGRMV